MKMNWETKTEPKQSKAKHDTTQYDKNTDTYDQFKQTIDRK